MNSTVKSIPAKDTSLFKYFGTWQATDEGDPCAMVSYWTAAYVEFDFTGDSVTLLFSQPSSFRLQIDNGQYMEAWSANGQYTVSACGKGKHTLRISSQSRRNHIYFAGVATGEECSVSRTCDKPHYIQFIGDSISETPLSFSHRSADILGWDYSVIACSAISLVRNRGYWRTANGWYWESTKGNCRHEGTIADRLYKNFGCLSIGMEDAFFKLGIPSYPSNGVSDIKDDPEFEDLAQNYFTPKYDFNFATGNTPDIVFIFLGTNDLTLDDPMPMCDAFVESYMQFVSKILDIYGKNTKICIMQGLTGGRGEPISLDSARISSILRAAKALMHEYPDNVCYIDHETVASWGTEISEDKTHPSPKGYDTLTHEVAKYLAEHFDTRA